MSAPPFLCTQRNKWLGIADTAANTVPATAGLDVSNLMPLLVTTNLKINGASVAGAIVGLLRDTAWETGAGSNIQAAATMDTANAQSATANDVPLETANAANSGRVFGADVKFGAISLSIGTNSAGTPARVIEYWNGSAWTAIAAAGMLVDIPRSSAHWGAAGTEYLILWVPPMNWERGGSGTNVSQTRYNIRWRCTTAPTTAGVANRAYLGILYDGDPAIAANSNLTSDYTSSSWPVHKAVAAIGAAVGGTANEGHVLKIIYR